MDLEDELRGSDEVEHGIHEVGNEVVETKHVLGKRLSVVRKSSMPVDSVMSIRNA